MRNYTRLFNFIESEDNKIFDDMYRLKSNDNIYIQVCKWGVDDYGFDNYKYFAIERVELANFSLGITDDNVGKTSKYVKKSFDKLEDAMQYAINLPNSNVSNRDKLTQRDVRDMMYDIKEKLEIIKSLGESYAHSDAPKYMHKSVKKCLTLLK